MNQAKELTLSYDELFSLNAGEARAINAWTEKFLPCWNTFKNISQELIFVSREKIVVEPKSLGFYKLITNEKVESKDLNEKDYEEDVKFEDLPTEYPLLGCYHSDLVRRITYFEHFYTASEEIKHIVRIHERMHAFHHQNRFEGIWSDFNNVSPVYLEFLAQLFTFKCVQKTYLEKHFRVLSKEQPFIYQTWELVENKTTEEIVALYCKIKTEDLSGIALLDTYVEKYPEKNNENIINNWNRHIDKNLTDAMDDLW